MSASAPAWRSFCWWRWTIPTAQPPRSPAPWKTRLPLTVQRPADLPEEVCRDLANWYAQDLAPKATPGARTAMLEKARECYQSFLARHSAEDAQRTAALLAMKKLDAELGTRASPEGPAPVAGPKPELRPDDDPRDLRLVTAAPAVAGVKSWTITTREPMGATRKLAVRADKAQFATVDMDMSIRIYETETGRILRILPPPAVELIVLAYSPDGTRLAWADRRYVRLLDSASGKLAGVIDAGAAADIRAMAWSHDSRRLACVGGDRTFRAWDARTHRPLGAIAMKEVMHGLAYSPDGRWIAIVEYAGGLLICDAQTGRLVRSIPKVAGHSVLEWSPDSHSVAVVADGDRTVICDAVAGKVLREIKVKTHYGSGGLAWSPDGQRLACGGLDGEVVILRTKDWSAQDPLQAGPRGDPTEMPNLAWMPDSQRLLVNWKDYWLYEQAGGDGPLGHQGGHLPLVQALPDGGEGLGCLGGPGDGLPGPHEGRQEGGAVRLGLAPGAGPGRAEDWAGSLPWSREAL